jgi:hypothetical protein
MNWPNKPWRRGDLAEIEARAKAAEEKARRHYEAERRLAAEVEKHKEFLRRLSGAEAEATGALEAVETLQGALLDAMLMLQSFEHKPLLPVARQWKVAGTMCRQLTEAIDVFTGSAGAYSACAERAHSATGVVIEGFWERTE